MKKILFVILLIGLVTPLQVHAEGLREQRRELVGEFRSKVAENHANRLEKRFTFYYERMEKIIARFQTRLDTLKGQGKDTAPTQAELNGAMAQLVLAKSKGEAAIAAFRALDPTKFQEQKIERLAARDLAKEARGLFLETHQLLKEALKSLKTISKPALPAASVAVESAN
ncbi:MAG: hypothetical protein V1487_01060 [bacterium]